MRSGSSGLAQVIAVSAYLIAAAAAAQCPKSVQYEPTSPVGYNTSTWYGQDSKIVLTASPAVVSCCPSGTISSWSIQQTNANASKAWVGSVAATCTDGSSLAPVIAGYNGTTQPMCDSNFPQATVVPSPSDGNFKTKSGSILNYLLGVGDDTNTNPLQSFQCGQGLSPVGFSAASQCLAVTSFQVVCGFPMSPPTQAPASSAGSAQAGRSTSGGLPGAAIGGIVAGAILGVQLVGILAWLYLKRRRRKERGLPMQTMPADVERDDSMKQLVILQQKHEQHTELTPPPKVTRGSELPKGQTEEERSSPESWKVVPAKSDLATLGSKSEAGLSFSTDDMNSVTQFRSDESVFGSKSASTKASAGSRTGSSAVLTRPVSRGGSALSSLHTIPSDDLIRLDELRYVISPETREPILLGKGAYGMVLKGVLGNEHNIPVAIKAVREHTSASQRRSLLQEATLLRNLRHSNIVTLFGACQEDDSVLLVMEELAGDLFQALHASNNPELYLWRNRGRSALLQIAEGLNYLHYRRIIHFDLKTSNVLLTHDGTAKLTDVGLSGVLGSKTHLSQEQGFTMAYAAPEVLLGRPCKSSSDIYSFGVMMWEIVAGKVPERGRMGLLRVPEQCSQEVSDLIERCLDIQPNSRPTVVDVIRILRAQQ